MMYVYLHFLGGRFDKHNSLMPNFAFLKEKKKNNRNNSSSATIKKSLKISGQYHFTLKSNMLDVNYKNSSTVKIISK
jgi:cbb3-type cytochrome oxidase cytochrome c subunit